MTRELKTHPETVSYCTTCKGRLKHLKESLLANMAAERSNVNVQFVVLDYGCPDGTFDWLKQTFGPEIESGRLKCARYESAPTFEHAHAKNMVHRLATGDILCNVDADNFIAPNFSRWLAQTFSDTPETIVLNMPVTLGRELEQKILWRLLRKRLPTHGLAGRIAIRRTDFERLRGYDESGFSGSGGEDIDFGLRSREINLKATKIPHRLWGDVIRHGDHERFKFSSNTNKMVLEKSLKTSRVGQLLSGIHVVRQRRELLVNRDGNVGCGSVYINFDVDPTTISPLETLYQAAA